MRLTHPSSKKSTAFAGYTEVQWDDYRRELIKLQVAVPEALVEAFALAVGADLGGPDLVRERCRRSTKPPAPLCGPSCQQRVFGVRWASIETEFDGDRQRSLARTPPSRS